MVSVTVVGESASVQCQNFLFVFDSCQLPEVPLPQQHVVVSPAGALSNKSVRRIFRLPTNFIRAVGVLLYPLVPRWYSTVYFEPEIKPPVLFSLDHTDSARSQEKLCLRKNGSSF